MAYNAKVYEIMIASPSDVSKEKGIIREAIEKWNMLHSKNRGIVLRPIAWDTDVAPEMGSHPQEIINREVLAHASILVAVLRMK